MLESDYINIAKSGDYAGYNYLLKTHWDYVRNYLINKYKDSYLAEEICIQTFAKAFDKINTYKETYAFRTWLIQIAKNLAIDENRKKKIHTEPMHENTKKQISDAVPSIEDEIIKNQDANLLVLEIKKLPAQYQEIIELRYFKEMSFKAISLELGIPVNNLKVRSLRARKSLFQQLNPKS